MGGGHPDPEITAGGGGGGGAPPKIFFLGERGGGGGGGGGGGVALSKNFHFGRKWGREGPSPQGHSPGSATGNSRQSDINVHF